MFGVLAGLIVLCVAISSITAHFIVLNEDWSQHDSPHGHQWLHEALKLTDEEATAIDAFEPEYRASKAALQADFQSKIEELREQLLNSDQFSLEVQLSIHELHLVHGQLQELSIRHYFDMMSVLPPEKQAHLKELASQALSVPQ